MESVEEPIKETFKFEELTTAGMRVAIRIVQELHLKDNPTYDFSTMSIFPVIEKYNFDFDKDGNIVKDKIYTDNVIEENTAPNPIVETDTQAV